MATAWVRWAEMQVLEAADVGGYVLVRRQASKYSRYLMLWHPRRPQLLVRVSCHQAQPPFKHKPGEACDSFDVFRSRGLVHLVRMLSRGRLSLTLGEVGAAMPDDGGSGDAAGVLETGLPVFNG